MQAGGGNPALRGAAHLGRAWLERAAGQGEYRSLALLAPSPFRGELRAELGPAELEKRILRELAR